LAAGLVPRLGGVALRVRVRGVWRVLRRGARGRRGSLAQTRSRIRRENRLAPGFRRLRPGPRGPARAPSR